MRITVFIVSALLFFMACRSNKTTTEKSYAVLSTDSKRADIDSVFTSFNMKYELLTYSPDSAYILISLSQPSYHSSLGRSGIALKGRARYWNIYFYNRKTSKGHLLTQQRIGIEGVRVAGKAHELVDKVLEGKILYVIRDIDRNKDGVINHKDPEFLFVSEYDGTDLQRISPINEDLNEYYVIPGKQEIVMKTYRNKGTNSTFNLRDEKIWYHARIVEGQWKLSEMINNETRHEIDSLFFQQWMEVKE